jgi:hypothetical protein
MTVAAIETSENIIRRHYLWWALAAIAENYHHGSLACQLPSGSYCVIC